MKRIITIALVLMLLGMSACKDNTVPEVTTVGDGASTSRIETTVTTAGTTETEEETTETEEPFDTAAFLAECTVYEVTTELSSYQKPYLDLEQLDISERPAKIALRFSDAEGLTILMKLAGDGKYRVKHMLNDNISIPVDDEYNFTYLQISFGVETNSEMTVIRNGVEGVKDYYVLRGNGYELLSNLAYESGYVIDIVLDSNEIFRYGKYNWKYAKPKHFSGLVEAYESDDDFYCERGKISFESGDVIFIPENTMTFGEYCKTGSWYIKDLFEKYDVSSFGELIIIYQQYVDEGRENEFY